MSAYQRIFIFLFFICPGCQYLIAQKPNWEYLTVKDGLPQNTVSSIVKDKYGFMWFGTWNGLCRYDGYRFKVYNTIPGDSSSIANNRIHYIYKDRQGTLWISTFNSFICRYNYETDNFTQFRQNQLPKAIRDSANRQQNLSAFEHLAEELRRQIGAFRFSPSKEHIVFELKPNKQGGISDNNVYCAYKDTSGLLWLGTVKGGVNIADLNAKAFHSYPIAVGNKTSGNTPIRAILADSAGIWLGGSLDDGLIYIDRKTKAEKRFTQGPLTKNVRSIFKDSYGDIWIGYRDGLNKYDARSHQFINYFKGSSGGIGKYNRFYSIAEDPVDRSLWFGTFREVLRYDRTTGVFQKQALDKYFNHSSAVCLFFDSRGNLWIGTEYAGIIQVKRDPGTRTWTDTVNYRGRRPGASLPDDRVYSITEDEQGTIWAGTANGLCRIDPKTGAIRRFTRQQGLADQYIAKLLPDGRGHIWISHKNGLSKLATSTGVIRNYSVTESFEGSEFLDGSGYLDPSTGELYFGNMEGFVSFHPREITDNSNLPTVALTEFQVLNKPVGVGQLVNERVILREPIHMAKRITLTHNDRSFSIEFTALQYANPEKNQYAYMLEGQDKNWIHTDASRRVATYSNLPEGTYVFKVKASNSDGVWNTTPTSLQITVLPPWWRTGWAYLGYTFLLLLAGFGVYRLIRIRQRYNQEILTERIKAEKAQELDQLKSRFFTNVSHEFRTPLTLIIDPLESLLSGKQPVGKVRDYVAIMHRNARRLLHLINQFLDFRKLESGSMPLHVTRQDIVVFVRKTVEAFEFQAQKRDIDLTLDTKIEALEFGFDADVVDKILYNLLSNAFKFTPEGGYITVSLATLADHPEQVVLSIKDNGVGIPPHLTHQIFEPFYQVESKEHSHTGGTGVGLSLTRELVTLHQGTITVSSEPRIETCFTVTLSNLATENVEHPINEEQLTFQVAEDDSFTSLVQEQASDPDPALVLVVEDNADVRSYLKMNLSAEYKVIEAPNGTEGFEIAIETIPDLIISDIMMPGLNGLDLCRKLKTDEKTSHIPVILLTARQSDQYKMEGYETGADAYIGKPFNTVVLLARIKNLLASRKKLRELFSSSVPGFDTRLVATNAADKAFLSKATGLIEENMSHQDFSVEWLASQLLLSRIQLYRKIKALTNQTVHEFITTIRLNKAAELLLEGQLNVTEIAYAVGYSDSTSFSRVFQKQYGQTPKKFSQQGKKDFSK